MPRASEPSGDPGRFLEDAERRLLDLGVESQRADWVYATYISPDTEALASRTLARYLRTHVDLAKASATIPRAGLAPDVARRLDLLRLALPLVPPSDPAEGEELPRLVNAMTGAYGRARYRPAGAAEPLDVQAIDRQLGELRDPARLRDLWEGWHRMGPTVRAPFERYVDLANRGARELGFDDHGAMWRSKYDLPAAELAREVDRLWEEVRPLYVALHAYVRHRLVASYGADVVPPDGPIPIHLLGNLWAQDWSALLPVVGPATGPRPYDLTAILKGRGVDARGLVRYAERFFTSLGLPPLPDSFWERSMFERPRDREVVCHASAWDIDFVDDLRIKMCIETTAEEFRVVHHELGHNYYQRAYADRPFLYRDGAHDGFHEAIGDTIALSVTPEYLARIGLLDRVPGPEGDLGLLFAIALEKIAFLPFGLLLDRWRWGVFSGAIAPEAYNTSFWAMRRELQGVAPPSERDETWFDPGAKFHVPANVPYLRYFLAHLLQFQFHRAFARLAGGDGPLHRVSIFGSRPVGERFAEMLALGQSRPWPEALAAATGERRMDGAALLEYFAPLRRWLDEENRGHPVGW